MASVCRGELALLARGQPRESSRALHLPGDWPSGGRLCALDVREQLGGCEGSAGGDRQALAASARRLVTVPTLVFRGRTAGDLAKDAMELRVAAEPCVERRVEQRTLEAAVAVTLVAVEESLHALAVAEFDDGKPGLLFEEAAEA